MNKLQHKGFYRVDTTDRRNVMDTRRASDYKIDNDPLLCEYRSDFIKQCERIDQFIEEAEPLMNFVRTEILHNTQRSQFYLKITENVIGAGVLSILGIIGLWVLSNIKVLFAAIGLWLATKLNWLK